MDSFFIWLGIAFCLSQSAIFSGLNLAFFSLTRLRLEIEAESTHSYGAKVVLSMRRDSNFLLTTILWGNVGVNVLLTLLSDSVMVGVVSFAFSTIFITLFGEILPQAYFSRNAMKMASLLSPILRVYQFLLYPVAKPCALLLDSWLGKEAVQFFSEENINMFIRKHMEGSDNEIDHVEGIGAINFFSLDDQKVMEEGEIVNSASIIELKSVGGNLVFPQNTSSPLDNLFMQQINRSGKKWIIFTDEGGEPKLVLDADGFIRSEVFGNRSDSILNYCHAPLVIRDEHAKIGKLIKDLKAKVERHSDAPIETDIVLFWTSENKRIITGADLFGRLLQGI
ncbi:MAG: DUF21 domain-containing protein [Saprospiraceae bacterium]|nr:DUF21 domain-containing protein [Saprospiraceae bacterium]